MARSPAAAHLFPLMLVCCLASPATLAADAATRAQDAERAVVSLDGRTLEPLPRSAAASARLEANLTAAREAWTAEADEMNTIWLGRRLAYLNRYGEAIEVFSNGLRRFPDSYRLLRHRGHRHISTRRFDAAIADFERAYALMPKGVVETEPDGAPNRLNIPLSNTQFNVLYHWGLAHYLRGDFARAAALYRECLTYSPNDDLRVATADWLWMALRRHGTPAAVAEATALLDTISADMEIIENDSYLKRLLFYKGELPLEALLRTDAEDASLALATQGYGVANHHLVTGDPEAAAAMFERVLATGNWPAFGYIAAEADRFRGAAEQAAAAAVLDRLHAAAAAADWDSYFALYTPDATFLGTDASEIWSVDTLRGYAAASNGWTYVPRLRETALLSPNRDVVAFHELLDNAGYGTARGSGAVVRTAAGWKVAQYNLAFPVPNALAQELTQRIRAWEAEAGAP